MNVLDTLDQLDVSNGTVRVGDAVSAQSKGGYICEGNVYMMLPWGAEWFDKTWVRGTVVIKDHETGQYSNWNPLNVTKL